MATENAYGAIVLDVMLPGLDGFQLCRRLREAGTWAPVLMLTARDGVGDRVRGLDAGTDDYLVKPFSLLELAARLRALARRDGRSRPVILAEGDLRLRLAVRQRRGVGPAEHHRLAAGRPAHPGRTLPSGEPRRRGGPRCSGRRPAGRRLRDPGDRSCGPGPGRERRRRDDPAGHREPAEPGAARPDLRDRDGGRGEHADRRRPAGQPPRVGRGRGRIARGPRVHPESGQAGARGGRRRLRRRGRPGRLRAGPRRPLPGRAPQAAGRGDIGGRRDVRRRGAVHPGRDRRPGRHDERATRTATARPGQAARPGRRRQPRAAHSAGGAPRGTRARRAAGPQPSGAGCRCAQRRGRGRAAGAAQRQPPAARPERRGPARTAAGADGYRAAARGSAPSSPRWPPGVPRCWWRTARKASRPAPKTRS